MKCHACDKPLTTDEARECFDTCFPCERHLHIVRLVHHVRQERITMARILELLYAAAEKAHVDAALERTSGR